MKIPYFMKLHSINDNSHYDDEFCIREHVSSTVAQRIFEEYWREERCPENDSCAVNQDESTRCTCMPLLGPWVQKYGRWSMESGAFVSGLDYYHTLRLYASTGKGRFPITVAEPLEIITRRERFQLETEATRLEFQTRWPSLTIKSVEPGRVRFSADGLLYGGQWDGEVFKVARVDHDALQELLSSGVTDVLPEHDSEHSEQDYQNLIDEYTKL